MVGASCATSSTGAPDAADDDAPDAAVNPPDARPTPDANLPDGAPSGPGFFIDDNPDDFNGSDAVFTATEVTGFGAITPLAYYSGGLELTASDDGVFTAAGSTDWTTIEAMTFTGNAAAAHSVNTSWASAAPPGVGLTDGDNLTLVYSGEIYLEAGSWTFFLLADDHGILELAAPGTTSFSRVASADCCTEASGGYTAGSSGWHPIRIALAEQTGSASIQLEHLGPTVASRAPVSRHRLRFRAGHHRGLMLSAFDDAYMLAHSGITLDDTAPADADWGEGNPADLGLSDSDTFATRWAGQLRIDVAGDYSFRYISDDGHRLWIDGVLILDAWDETSHDDTTDPINLDLGWHDIVIDQMEISDSAQAKLSVANGPQGTGRALSVDRLRPIVTRRERYESGVNRADVGIPDNGSISSTIAIDAPPGAKAAGVEVSWSFTHSYHGDLEIHLRAPDGSAILVRDNQGGSDSGSVTERMFVTGLDGATASGNWQLEVTDTTSLDTGTLLDFQLTVHHRAGEGSIPTTASYVSNIKDLGGGVSSYDQLSWGQRLAPGASIQLRVRSGGSPGEVATAPWSTPVLDAGGSDLPELPRRYFQYRIDFTSDGDGAPAVDWVRLDYTQEGS